MEREHFERNLHTAAARAREFALTFLEETLPTSLTFRVHLNSSNDAGASAEFTRHPEDSSAERTRETKRLSASEVVELLWRDGRVPQWIDVTVVSALGHVTLIELLACGRFIADVERLYYTHTDSPPFGVKGPSLPFDYVEGRRFSLFHSQECWRLDEFARVRAHAASVWSLDLRGPEFDDAALCTRAPSELEFSNLEILELDGTRIEGAGFSTFANLPRLRVLRIGAGDVERLSFDAMPVKESIRILSLDNLPSHTDGIHRLPGLFSTLEDFSLSSTHPLTCRAPIAFPRLARLSLSLPRIPASLEVSPKLRDMTIHCPAASEQEVKALLAQCPSELESVGLRGTPVSDSLLADLERFPALRYLDAKDTKISPEALHVFAAKRTKFRCHPAPVPSPQWDHS